MGEAPTPRNFKAIFYESRLFQNKPIIGIVGGIGSGKTLVAKMLGEMGCGVIHSDDDVRLAYDDPAVRQTIRQWWGGDVFKADGSVDRGRIGKIVFNDPAQRKRLEGLLHPWVANRREKRMREMAASALAFVWDSPLLFETGLNSACDAVIFVDATLEKRLERVAGRGWDAAELARREKSQWPLDKKRLIADYMVVNTADADTLRGQVSRLLSRILSSTVEESAR
jgi:dephospho-CoA kinase